MVSYHDKLFLGYQGIFMSKSPGRSVLEELPNAV
jgi:hypothetical protein